MLPAAQSQLQNTLSRSTSNSSSITVYVKLQVNQLAGTIPSWLQRLPSGDIDVLEGNLFSCSADRSDVPVNDPKAATYECGSDITNYGLIAFGGALVCVSMIAGLYWYCMRDSTPSRSNITASFQKHYGESEVKKLWEHMEIAVYVIVGMWVLGMVVYGLLSLQFTSYTKTYVWAVSAVFKSGLTPGIILFLFLTGSVFSVFLFVQIPLLPIDNRMQLFNFYLLFGSCGVDTIAFIVLLVLNSMVVIVVNGLYVYFVVSADSTFELLLLVAFFLSLFKIVWNFALLRGSQSIESISDNTVVWLCLFNNLLAPLLAEMFVSSDCFLYIVTQAPTLIFNYVVYSCQFESKFIFSGELCSVPVLFEEGRGTTFDVSIIPPFHYSYQCSFSLISSYAYVFIFRYVITGLIELLIQLLLYWVSNNIGFELKNTKKLILRFLPPIWQTIVVLETSKEKIDEVQDQLQLWINHIRSGMFRRRVAVLLVTDLGVLICFGALFPPLAVVIALSVLKDVMSIRLALGRYCEIMEAVQDEGLKEQMVQVRESMDEEMLKAGAGIWNGVWYGMVMGTWIWGFVLFDTMASVEGVDKGLCMLIVMIMCPLVVYFVVAYAKICSWELDNIRRARHSADGEVAASCSNRTTIVEMNGSIISSNPLHDGLPIN
jgi:hypothetical protein